MLKGLKLKNLALIEIIEINFEKGLNVFTGESGSGKSLILDSINSLFGGTNIPLNHLIRPGQSECLIEASFSISPKVKTWLKNNNFNQVQNELTIQRKTFRKNKKVFTKYFINNLLVNKKMLSSLSFLLVDYSGQSNAILFNSQDYIREFIDDMCLEEIKNINFEVKNKWKEFKLLEKDIEEKLIQVEQEKQNYFASSKILQILENADLNSEEEIITLKSKQLKLANNFELTNALNKVSFLLSNIDTDLPSVNLFILDAIKEIKRVVKYDQNIDKIATKLISMQNQIEDISYLISDYLTLVEDEEGDLEEVQQRLFKLQNLEKTFSLELSDLIKKRNELRKSNNIYFREEEIKKLQNKLLHIETLLNKLFRIQFLKRQKIAMSLQQSVNSSLKILGLENSKFLIDFKNTEKNCNGNKDINFLFSANPDQALAPMSQVISGGEMSRFSLALKANNLNISNTLFLDEIDSGLSGKSLLALVSLIKKMSDNKQILCITHNPILAAKADFHFKVKKNIFNSSTFTSISELKTKKEKQHEIAELIGGGFNDAFEYASSIIDQAAA